MACPTLYTVVPASALKSWSRSGPDGAVMAPDQNGMERSVTCGLVICDHMPNPCGWMVAPGVRLLSSASMYESWGFVPFSGLRTRIGSRAVRWEMRLVGSSRSPDTMAWVGHTIWQEGCKPTSTRCAQKLHFAAVSVFGSMYRAS